MILTCPACDTKYVVKDGAIPPEGRQVRCAACKHSWHQDGEEGGAEPKPATAGDFGGPPPPPAEPVEQPGAEFPPEAIADDGVAGEPQAHAAGEQADGGTPWGTISTEPADLRPEAEPLPATEPVLATEPVVSAPEEPAATDWPSGTAPAGPAAESDEDFVGYAPILDEEDRPRRRWPLLLAIIVLIVAAAAAFWFFAPPEWKQTAGVAEAGATPLQLMITTSDRQPLQSGNELVAISGRVINPTDKEQKVPPIQAELRDRETRQLVHRWTIAPPARVLGPRSSASFNSAEVDVPRGGDELTVTLGAGNG